MDKLIFSPKTFQRDHILRDSMGKPLGRVVLVDDDSYIPGNPIQVSILKVPVQFDIPVKGLLVWVDDICYKIPEKFIAFRFNKREKDWVASSFILDPVK